ncbi:KEOPS complex Pcc1-like subunit [Candidatus Woesearchaeota archaeon]|nr:KEOPS complex Pcc1-like subunit [Candidatus Woesearchaeota archaeon]
MEYLAQIKIRSDADLVYKTLLPDKKDLKADRSSYTIKKSDGEVLIDIKAADAVALRAAINAITKSLDVIEKISRI